MPVFSTRMVVPAGRDDHAVAHQEELRCVVAFDEVGRHVDVRLEQRVLGEGDLVVELLIDAGLLAQPDQRVGEGGGVLDRVVAADPSHRLVHADLVAQPLGLAQDVVERAGGGDGVEARRLAHVERLGVHPDPEPALLVADPDALGRPLDGDDDVERPRARRRRRLAADRAEDEELGAVEGGVERDLVGGDAGDHGLLGCQRRREGEEERGQPQHRPTRLRARRARRAPSTRSASSLRQTTRTRTRQEDAQLLGAEPHREADPDLRPDDPADEQDEGQHHVDGAALGRVHHCGEAGDEEELEDRGADHDLGRHADQVDHRRHHDEAAADAHDRAEDADHRADHEGRDGADVEVGGAEAHLERQAVRPGVAAARHEHGVRVVAAADRADALHQHQPADCAEHDDVEKAHHQVELAERAQAREDRHAEQRARGGRPRASPGPFGSRRSCAGDGRGRRRTRSRRSGWRPRPRRPPAGCR